MNTGEYVELPDQILRIVLKIVNVLRDFLDRVYVQRIRLVVSELRSLVITKILTGFRMHVIGMSVATVDAIRTENNHISHVPYGGIEPAIYRLRICRPSVSRIGQARRGTETKSRSPTAKVATYSNAFASAMKS